MTESSWRFILMLGLVAFAVGAYLGLAPVSVPAINLSQDCGSVFFPTKYAEVAGSLIVAECDSKRNDRRTASIVLIFAGGVVAGYARRQADSLGKTVDPEREEKIRARFEDDRV